MSVVEIAFSEHEARELTDEVKADAEHLWSKLLRLYEGNAHLALGYRSWGAYYESEFRQSGNYGYRMVQMGQVMARLPNGQRPRPANERVARELVPLLDDDELLCQAWDEACHRDGDQPSAELVREVVHELKAPKQRAELPHPDPSPAPVEPEEGSEERVAEVCADLATVCGALREIREKERAVRVGFDLTASQAQALDAGWENVREESR